MTSMRSAVFAKGPAALQTPRRSGANRSSPEKRARSLCGHSSAKNAACACARDGARYWPRPRATSRCWDARGRGANRTADSLLPCASVPPGRAAPPRAAVPGPTWSAASPSASRHPWGVWCFSLHARFVVDAGRRTFVFWICACWRDCTPNQPNGKENPHTLLRCVDAAGA